MANPQAAPNSEPGGEVSRAGGFPPDEKGPGKLQIRFALINHSDADLGDISLLVNVRAPPRARSSDPPMFTFPATVQGVGPAMSRM